ncbi:MAG: EF-hand domain-containing protein [Planctomycetaceae bacterium]|nr:EF-hand domain-containing protein [Planctomycetaceae bacterium]
MLLRRGNWWRIAALGLAVGWGETLAAQDGGRSPDDLFKQLDKNSDGVIKASEVGEDQTRHFERLIRVADKDGNGELTREEFLEGVRRPDRPAGERPEGDRGPGERGPGDRPRFGPEQLFERFDANKDGKLTLEELPNEARERLRPFFERSGRDAISREDLGRLMAQAGGRPGEGRPGEGRPEGRPMLPRLFQRLDANGDGRLSKEELAKAADQFDAMDENRDGQLDPRELLGPPPGERRPGEGRPEEGRPGERRPEGDRRPEGERRPEGNRPEGPRPEGQNPERRRRGGEGGPPFERILSEMDSNKDGKLSKDEARGPLQQNFDRLDADKDGFITRDEIRRGFSERLREGTGRPEGGRPGARRPDGERPDGKRPPGDRPAGERPPEKKPE